MELQRIRVTEAVEPLVQALTRDGAAVLVPENGPAIEVRAHIDASTNPIAPLDLLSPEYFEAARAWRNANGLNDLDAAALVRAMRDEDD